MKTIYLALHKAGVFKLTRSMYKMKRSLSILLHGTYGVVFDEKFHSLHYGLHTDDLEKILFWIRKENIPFLTIEEYVNRKPGIHITLDDGYSNNYEHGLKIFEKFEVPITIFVTTKHIQGRVEFEVLDHVKTALINFDDMEVTEEMGNELFYGLSTSQLEKLAEHPLVEIGGHTHNHPKLTECTEQEIRNELVSSNRIIEEMTGSIPNVFAYPFGEYDETVKKVVKEVGYNYAFAVCPKGGKDLRFGIPRIGLYGSKDYYLSAKLSYLHGTI